jgi:hypothetical protein
VEGQRFWVEKLWLPNQNSVKGASAEDVLNREGVTCNCLDQIRTEKKGLG